MLKFKGARHDGDVYITGDVQSIEPYYLEELQKDMNSSISPPPLKAVQVLKGSIVVSQGQAYHVTATPEEVLAAIEQAKTDAAAQPPATGAKKP